MQEIIQISQNTIGNSSVHSVSARDLHRELGVKKDFTNWIKYQLEKGFFIESEDYIIIRQKRRTITRDGKTRGTVVFEYFLTLDTAKEIAMMSRTEKGKMIRNYFIKVEEAFKLQISKPVQTRSDLISVSKEELEQELTVLEFTFKHKNLSELEKDYLLNQTLKKVNFTNLDNLTKYKETFSLTELLEVFQISILPQDFNRKLKNFGIIKWSQGNWILLDLKFGRNFPFDDKTNPRYFKSTFQELLDIVFIIQ